ncbi:MAG TPA: TIGR02265 family protein [Longimicrobiales bacterium]|nr:TIGR02265 family protein [Longimicrobiales bacterium]
MSTKREAEADREAPIDWAQELATREALATPRDTVRGMFFNGTLEAVRVLGDEAAVARCQEVLGGQQFITFFNYPIGLLLKLTATAAEALSPRYGGFEQALQALGRKATADFMQSTMGNMMRLMARSSIRHMMSSMQTVYGMVASHGVREMTWQGGNRGRLVLRRIFMPLPYHKGALLEMLEQGGAQNVRVEGQQVGPLDCEFFFSWEGSERP